MAKSSIVERRKLLRAEIKDRQREVLPRLKAAVDSAKKAKTKRILDCQKQCKIEQKKVKDRAVQAKKKLAEHIKRAKARARSACGACRVTATQKSLDELDRAVKELNKEYEKIKAMQTKAAGMKSERGRKGGQRAAELRAESDERVIYELGDNKDLIDLFKKVRRKIKKTPQRSRIEAFWEYVHDHPQDLDEIQAKNQLKYEKEIEKMYEERAGVKGMELELDQCQRELRRLRRAEELALQEVPF